MHLGFLLSIQFCQFDKFGLKLVTFAQINILKIQDRAPILLTQIVEATACIVGHTQRRLRVATTQRIRLGLPLR